MLKEEIISILSDWNLWEKDLIAGIDRPNYREKLEQMLKSGQVIVITGARRSGKSFIMRQLANSLVMSGINRKNILLINFEDPRLRELSVDLLTDIFNAYREYIQPQGKLYIFLDEVQEVEQWEKWVRMMHELDKATLIISGSNARLLSRELSTVLTGRHLDIEVMPLSFKEFLNFNNISIPLSPLSDNTLIKGLLRNYLDFGGFPEAVKRENKKEILLSYFNDMIEKDLIQHYHIRKADKIKTLANYYFSNISVLTTFNSSGKTVDITPDTAKKFSEYLNNAYLFFFLKRFSFKTKEQEKSPRKVYAIDTGLARAVGFELGDNIGRRMENAVFLELTRQCHNNSSRQIFYWKDNQNHEVDFVIREKNNVIQLIQVCWNVSKIRTKQRELSILLRAMEELRLEEGLIITAEENREEIVAGKKISYISLDRWLLKDADNL